MAVELEKMRSGTPAAEPLDDFPVQGRSRSRTLMRAAIWIGALLVIGGAVAFVVARRARAVPAMHYETAATDRGTIAAKVTATGSLSALLTVQVGSQVSGRVQQLFADYNSEVHKGEVIAKLDPLLFQAQVDQIRANLLVAQSNLKKDQAQQANTKIILERSKSLQAREVIAQSDLDTAQANYDAASAQVEADRSTLNSIQAALSQAQLNLDYATIVSPIDGVVISRNVDVGQTVAASFQAPTLFVIARDLRQMQVDTSVGESDVGQLTAGMPATFTVDAYPNRPFVGKLRQIRNASQTVQNVVTYDAVIDVPNPELLLRPGMTANCTFVAAQKDNVIRLRNAALRFAPDTQLMQRVGVTDLAAVPAPTKDASRKLVWVLRANKPVRVQVVTGVTDGTWTELVSGDVKEGDQLITDMTPAPPRGVF
jgi:HlyD family secretion protein